MTAEPTHALARLFCHVNRAVMKVTEAVAVLLVVAETLILLAGVISRYGFDNPLTWSDELAQILFIWLSMLGAVLALDRGEHMRLSAIVNKLPAAWRDWFQTMAALTVCVFVALIIVPAYSHAIEQTDITPPALEIPDGLRAAALPVGAVLMLIAAVSRLARCSSLRQLGLGVLVVATLGAALWLGRPALIAMGNYNLLVFFVLIVGVCVAGGIPIAFAFGTATLAYLALVTDAPLQIVVSRMDEGMSGLILLSVPLFVLLGALIEMSGLARSLIEFMAALLGHVRGGLNYVLLGAMLLVSGISGAKTADMAAVAPVLLPEMKRRGNDEGELISLLAASGAMAETIPPSLVLITIGSVAGVSISALFTGGILPGVVLALLLALITRYRSAEVTEGFKRAPAKVVLRSLVVALPALVLPILIRTAVVEGVATATEVSTIGIAYAVVAGLLVYRKFDWRRLYPMLVDTAALAGAILFIIGTATGMSWALTQSGFSHSLAEAMTSVPGGKYGFLLVSIAAFVVLGSVLEGIPAMVLFAPLLFPVARAVGVHEVHYAMVVILSMGIGLFAPPFGLGYYAACTIGRVHPDVAVKRIWPYLGALLLGLLVVAFVPWFSTGFL